MIATLLLGGNMGNREAYLSFALFHITKELGSLVRKSEIYESMPWGKKADQPFLNQVIDIQTKLAPEELLSGLLTIEKMAGRTRLTKWANRTLDIDILFLEQRIIQSRHLSVPHPEIQHRRFTLVPLVEIKSAYIHPTLHQSMKELLTVCEDQSAPHKFKKERSV